MNETSQLLAPTKRNLERCAELILGGELVALPTETVYGLAGNGLSEDSIRKIFSVKGRPLIDPLIVHVPDLSTAGKYAKIPPQAHRLADRFWPGPLTMVLPKTAGIPDLATAGLPSAALRSPRHELFRSIMELTGVPLVAPSANPFGYVSPTRASHVVRTLGDRIGAILDGGPCSCGIESTIVDLRVPGEPTILRPGPIQAEALTEALGRPVRRSKVTNSGAAQFAPGTLSKHYSPTTRIELASGAGLRELAATVGDDRKIALLFMSRPSDGIERKSIYWLSEQADAPEAAAANLYELLQRLDRIGFQKIVAETPPESGLWGSIRDRLRRAAADA